MKQYLSLLLLFLSVFFIYAFLFRPRESAYDSFPFIMPEKKPEVVDLLQPMLSSQAASVKAYARRKGYATHFCFLVNLSLPSGQKRFFVYDLQQDSVLHSGLVAHGSCNTDYLVHARYSNTPNAGCSSLGLYRVGYAYQGQFGKAYKLFGLDSSNSNAFRRNVVLHAYSCVPDQEVFPERICNSLGCPMISYNFLSTLAGYIDSTQKPILLSITNDASGQLPD